MGKEPRNKALTEMLEIIRKNPGIRPSELNRILKREHSSGLRNTLIKQGLVKKQRDGRAMRYYVLSEKVKP